MATRTLGVKFEVAGVKEAQASFKQLKQGLNDSIAANKTAVNQSLGLNKTVRRDLEQTNPDDFVDNYQRTVQAIRNQQYRQAVNIYARPRINRTIGGFFEGIGNAAGGRAYNQLDSFFRKLTGREEYRESVDLSDRTINRIGESVANALTGKTRSQSQRDKNLGKRSQTIFQRETIVDKAITQALMPIRTIQYSFFEGIGSNFGNRFAEGLNQVLNDDLDISFERKGHVTGKAISFSATEGVNKFKQDISAVGDNFNDLRYAVEDGKTNLIAEKLDKLVKSISKSITSIADSYLRGFRRGSVQLEALRKIEGEIAKEQNQAPDLTGKKRAIFTVSGFAGEQGQRGHYMAQQLRPYVKDDTEVIGVENKFTDVLSASDKNTVLWGISALANLAKINLKGFNPDAVELAAKVVNTIAANPEVEIDLMGHSAGGFVVEEAQEILNQLGYGDRVTSRIVGTPRMAGHLDNANTEKIMGDNDFRIKPLEKALEYVGVAQPTDKIVKGVKDHFFQNYLDSDEFLETALGNSLDKEKVKNLRKNKSKFAGKLIELESLYVKYISSIYQNLDDLGEELSVAPDRLIAKSRRNKLRDRGVNELNKKVVNQDFKPINLQEGTETAVLVIGGFSGARGRSGATFAKQLNQLVDDGKTQYVGVRNPFTDVATADEIRNPDPSKTVPKILDMFAQVHQLGYNPDAVDIAAQAYDLLKNDPNLNVKIGGYSGGGYVAEDVIELLKSYGADMNRVQVMGVGTPQLPGAIKNREFQKIMGDRDPIMMAQKLKEYNNQFKEILGFDILPELMTKLQNVEGINQHDLDEYITKSQEVQNFFYGHIPNSSELIDNYSQIKSLQKDTSGFNDQVKEISQNDLIGLAERVERLNSIRQQYINKLRQIHTLAKYSQSIGGGKFFADEREVSALELEDAGVIVDPVRVQTPDPWEDTEEAEAEIVSNRAQQLANRYQVYLEGIKQKTKTDSQVSSQVIARDFASQNPAEQKNFLNIIRNTFNTRARAYRQAMKNGQLDIAKNQGENLLTFGTLIKNLYAELNDFTELDPEVERVFKSYSGYITSVENEVIGGSNARGRAKVGLPNVFEQQYNLLEQDGDNVSEGFVYGILDTLADVEDAGEQLGEALQEGTQRNLEIESPSKVFKRFGQWVVAGFRQGLAGFDQVGNELEDRGREAVQNAGEGISEQIEDTFDADNIANLLDLSGANLIKKIGVLLFDASQNEGFDRVINNIGNLIGKIIRLVVTFKLLKVALDAFGLGKLIEGFRNLPEEAINAAIAVEALDKRINDISGSASKGAQNLAFISDETAKLRRNLTLAKENYAQLLDATKNTSLRGVQTENIYSAFAATAKAKTLTGAEEQRLFRSIRSIIGKQIVSQEEVRQEIGELLGDFSQNLAEAYGVDVPQLNKMIENREIIATEALPKVAAVLQAKNGIVGEANTGAAAVAKLDNAIISFRESVGLALLPIQKFGNNFLAGFFNNLASGINIIEPLVHGFFLALFANLLRLQIFGQTVQKLLLGLIKLLWSFRGAIATFAAEMALLAAALKAWSTVGNMLRDRFFPQIDKDIAKLTRGMKAYRLAIEEAKGATESLGQSKLQLAQGFKLPDNNFGNAIKSVIGSDYLNLDSLVREPLNNKYGNFAARLLANITPGGNALSQFIPTKITTQRELNEQQLVIGNSRLSLKGNEILTESNAAFNAAKKITEYDAQIAEIQSKRLKLLPGDKEALEASIAVEQNINEQRDKQLKILTNYQQTLQTSINVYKTKLEEIEQKFLAGEIKPEIYRRERDNLTGILEDTEDKLKGVNKELTRVSNRLSVFQRRLRNSNERVEGFLATSDRELQQNRTAIIEEGIEAGVGIQTIELELDRVQQQDLRRRIDFLKSELTALEDDLKSPELEAATRRIKQNLKDSNIPINEKTLQRIIDDSPVKADRDAAQGLLDRLRRETQLIGVQEQLANTLQQTRTRTVDFSRSINDYFFRINQQISEAQIEVQRTIEQIIQTQIRNKLQSALSPNADSFVNQLISSTQSLLDQAASHAEKVLGQRQARIQFAGQKRSLQLELEDFARNVRGAGNALVEFQNKLRGNTNSNPAPKNLPAERSNNLTALRRAIIGKESGANFKAVNPHSGALGYGQVMPFNVASWTKQALGKSLTSQQFLNDADAQIKVIDYKLKQYLDRELGKGFDLDTAVRRVASTWYSGQPGLYNNTRPQTYGVGSYPSIDSYTKDILKRFYAEGGTANPIVDKAQELTDRAIRKQEQNLELQAELLNLEKQGLDMAVIQNMFSDRRKVDANITDSQLQLDKSGYAQRDLIAQYDFQTAKTEMAKSVRAVNTAYSDRARELAREIQKYIDEIVSINKLITIAPGQSKLLRRAGRDDEANILLQKAAQAETLLKPYTEILKGLIAQEKELNESAAKSIQFVTKQGQLKIQQEKLNKRSLLLNQKATFAEQRGNVEARRRVKIEQEKIRLQQEINRLKGENKPGQHLNDLIARERRQSKVNQENIDFDAQLEELELERRLIKLDAGIGEKNAGYLSAIGLNLQGDSIKKKNAIATENNRFKQELVKFNKQFKEQPELLDEFIKKAEELNRVNLESINQQFKTLGGNIQFAGLGALQNFFTNFSTNLFSIDSQRQELEERLRYAQEIISLENQYDENSNKLAFLKQRAKELNDEKLDNIRNEFGLLTRVIDFGRQALLNFVNSLAQIAAQQAAGAIFKAIFGGLVGGVTGSGGGVQTSLNFGSGVGAFVANKGATVGSRKVPNKMSSFLRNNFPGIKSAFNAEGSNAQLGVFHTGEELLSRKTGEAGAYQRLKSKLGFNPLQQLENYSQGGTVGYDIEQNILSGFPTNNFRSDLRSTLRELGKSDKVTVQPSKTVHLTQQIYTPDADSFGLSETQRNQDLMETMRRGF